MVGGERTLERIRRLNDEMRQAAFKDGNAAARWVMTRGVVALGANTVEEVVRCVADFDAFDNSNDPHGEHDFGAFEIAGERLFWKIDYYDRSLTAGSKNPADEAATCRVLTIMLASEY